MLVIVLLDHLIAQEHLRCVVVSDITFCQGVSREHGFCGKKENHHNSPREERTAQPEAMNTRSSKTSWESLVCFLAFGTEQSMDFQLYVAERVTDLLMLVNFHATKAVRLVVVPRKHLR